MATTYDPRPTTVESSSPGGLNRLISLAYLVDWEKIAYAVIFIMAVFTRFYDLGTRVMSHDESLHTRYSYNLYNEGNFQHTPLMHGPILFHIVAFFYFIFGDSDFTARIYPALLGILIVMFPLLFRRWLGRAGAVLTSVMLLISPMVMYYNRYIREDTPSIFYTIAMVYCTFMYLDGPEHLRRRGIWLYVFSAAMLASLGTKESGFIYIAVFGSFLTLYWVVRLAQRYLRANGRTLMYWLSIAFLLAGVVALGLYIVFTIVPPELVATAGPGSVEASAFISWLLTIIVIGLLVLLTTAVWAFRHPESKFLILEPFAIALIFLLAFFTNTVLQIATPWPLVGVVVVVLLAFWGFRISRGRLPWMEIALVVLIGTIACAGLVIIEEASRIEQASSEDHAEPADPGASAEVVGDGIRQWPLIVAWVVGAVVVAGIAVASRAGLFRALDEYPEFDVLIIMGTFILPWLTPLIIVLTGASPTDYSQAGIIRALLALIPMAAISIAMGLAWNWRRWLISAAVFHILFAFFFTTMFTNINGLATGMIGSLGYWLEQQAVRRGNQPQYYYTLIIMPFYEFLPVIGSISAMFAGITMYWRFRRDRLEASHPMDDDAVELAAANTATAQAFFYASQDAVERTPAETNTESSLDELLHPEIEEELTAISDDEIEHRIEAMRSIPLEKTKSGDNWLDRVPFLLFVSWWAVLNIIAYTLAGEKMPWLAIHLTVPMIFLTGWYYGRVFERVEIRTFLDRGWLYLILIPMFAIGVFQLIAPFITGQPPFAGLEQALLARTGNWLAVLAMFAVVSLVTGWLVRQTGWAHLVQMTGVVVFVGLALLTFRSAWMASFINYDKATEFIVYAHSAPAIKTVLNELEELSIRTTDGMGLRFAYDDESSWPNSWYFRDFPNAVFFGSSPSVQTLDNTAAVVVGDRNRSRVEPLLEDRYYRFDHIRMWWPMQDYFNLTAQRILNTFDFSASNTQAAQIRRGLFDIWWSRDYDVYGEAVGTNYDESAWPVSDRMHFYVRKDIAAQIWSLGVGDGSVLNPLAQEEVNVCTANWQDLTAEVVMGSMGAGFGQLAGPRGVAVSTDRQVYVAEENNHRISVFDDQGNFLYAFGQLEVGEFGTARGGNFNRPNGVAVGPDGNVYVADTWNHRVQVLTSSGEFIATWGQYSTGIEPGAFWGPRDIAVDASGRVYVADTGNKRIRVYDSQGTFLLDIGSAGSEPGQLNEPVGLAIDNVNGRLFVADTWNRRVSVFGLDGSHLFDFSVRAWYGEQGNRPYLGLDLVRDLIYVTDPDAGRVLVYNTAGSCVGSFGQPSRETFSNSQFGIVGGLTVDAEGRIYAADAQSGRVLRFAPFINNVNTSAIGGEPIGALLDSAESTAEVEPVSAAEQTSEVQIVVTEEVSAEQTAEVETTSEASGG